MSMNEGMRQRRRELEITRAAAMHLDVTASAVNKWEKGDSRSEGYGRKHLIHAYAHKNDRYYERACLSFG